MHFRSLIITGMAHLLFVSIPLRAQDAAPRYKLEVGQEIQYRESSESRYDAGGGYHFDETWTLWVIGRNPDGSWRIMERYTDASRKLDAPTTAPAQVEDELGRCNLFPDGRMESAEGVMAGYYGPEAILPRLPNAATDKSWQSSSPAIDYSVLPADAAGNSIFRFDDRRSNNSLKQLKHNGTFHFDMPRGLVVSGTSDWDQDYPRHYKSSGTLTLASLEKKDAAFIMQLSRESDIYFKATADYQSALGEAGKNAAKSPAITQEAKKQLEEARSHITLPLLTEPLDLLLAHHDRTAKAIQQTTLDRAQHIAAVMDKPAATWELTDLSGKAHRLSDYRGKVVLLDFWYRACGYCIETMPQIQQVSNDFKNDPLVVLGMNTDEDPKDAQFIVDQLGLTYTILRASGIPEKYAVDGFPTAILIDPQGIIRAVHVGWAPDAREQLDEEIRKYLPAKTASRP